jgi:hypothetical protein
MRRAPRLPSTSRAAMIGLPDVEPRTADPIFGEFTLHIL